MNKYEEYAMELNNNPNAKKPPKVCSSIRSRDDKLGNEPYIFAYNRRHSTKLFNQFITCDNSRTQRKIILCRVLEALNITSNRYHKILNKEVIPSEKEIERFLVFLKNEI